MSVALLAPVPEEHLISGQETLREVGKVAFGSKNWELFNKLAEFLKGDECDALLYASDATRSLNPPTVTWSARFVGFSVARNGAHKDGMKYRPASTTKYPLDNQGSWTIFWEVTNLKPISPGVKISLLRGFQKPHSYLLNFIPRGPVLVQAV
ncbi:hypothetical protein JQ600_02500 [Bradyrhizobium sp. AUGA SZCCT0176]|uniref:hypothetical protein n=1 Tax=Bradyrhizobium sp. AUGA SZCCT0176 TaxID=2807664 RepID=UPI001BA8CA20|nr:hypothetical protein [Bradyrhizobium sp. AUGA SZCCT0176]MBR1223768.1 hypothetical protein [Bradyrhizobium sp. AUGA SZCCT0176]